MSGPETTWPAVVCWVTDSGEPQDCDLHHIDLHRTLLPRPTQPEHRSGERIVQRRQQLGRGLGQEAILRLVADLHQRDVGEPGIDERTSCPDCSVINVYPMLTIPPSCRRPDGSASRPHSPVVGLPERPSGRRVTE